MYKAQTPRNCDGTPEVSILSFKNCRCKSILATRVGITHHPNDQEPHRANKPDQTQHRHAPQHHSHINRRAIRRRRVRHRHRRRPRRAQHHRTKRQVRKHPHQDNRAPETLVVVLLFVLCGDDLDFLGCLGGNDAHFGVILIIEVAVVLGDGDVDFTVGLELHAGQFLGFVVAFGAPGDVVGVAEGVNVEDVEVGGGEEEIMDELWGVLLNGRR